MRAHHGFTIEKGNVFEGNKARIAGGGIFQSSYQRFDFDGYPPEYLKFLNNYASFGDKWAGMPAFLELVRVQTHVQNVTFYSKNVQIFSNEPFTGGLTFL